MKDTGRFASFLTVTVAALLFTFPTAAQRQGPGSGAGDGTQQPRVGGGQAPKPQTPPTQPRGSADQDRTRARIHVSDAQSGQYRTCDGTAAQLHQHVQQMQKLASNRESAQLKQERDRLRDMINNLDRQFTQFRQGLSKEQAQQLETRLQALDRERDQVRIHQQSLDRELDSQNPVQQRLINRTQQIEQALERWQTKYRKLGLDIGVSQNE